jgi:predicted GNAT superfamily acetyltransferase
MNFWPYRRGSKLAEKILIKKLSTKDQFEKLVEIQKTVWGHPDLDLTPVHQFSISCFMGGLVLGALVDGQLAGFVYSFPAIYQGKFCHHSHLLAVLPQYRGYGLGRRLKWAQRREVLKMGLDLITWTYDPMQSRNANLNLHTLGAISRNYLGDFYGETPALRLGPGIPIDRLLVEWFIKSERVEKRVKSKKDSTTELITLPRVLEGLIADDGSYRPGKPGLKACSPAFLVETVRDIKALKSTPEIIAEWQAALRQTFNHYFREGYAIVDFIFCDQCYYVLKKFKSGKSHN